MNKQDRTTKRTRGQEIVCGHYGIAAQYWNTPGTRSDWPRLIDLANRIDAAIADAVAAEREACLRIVKAEACPYNGCDRRVAAAIRARNA